MIAKRTAWGCAAVLVALAVGISLPSEALAVKSKDPTKQHRVHGKVVAVVANADGTGSITVEHHKHKKGQAAAAGEPEVVKTFEVKAGTQFVRESATGPQPATLSDVHKGEHISIEHQGLVAEKVAIGHKPHNKK